MIRANHSHKALVADILTQSFDTNKSVNYIIRQDKRRGWRMRKLMEYAFEVCCEAGEVFLSDDQKGCALVLLPDRRKVDLKTILLDINFVLNCTGLVGVKRVLNREASLKRYHPREPFYYIWFIGVEPESHHRGIGSALLKEVIQEAHNRKRPVYLETSVMENVPWYEKHGLNVYGVLHLGCKLFLMKKNLAD